MPIPLIPIVAGLAVAGGATGAYLVFRSRRGRVMGGIPSQDQVGALPFLRIPATTRMRIPGQTFEPISAQTFETIRANSVGKPSANHVSQEDGWEPVWIRKGNVATLHWGFCIWDLAKAQQNARTYDKGRFLKFFNTVFEKAMGWVISIIKAATIDMSICFRIELPMGHIDLQDGRSFWIPCEPPIEASIEANPSVIQGWSGGKFLGFSATVAPWPLGNTPADAIGGAWIRALGDHWGWGEWGQPVHVYQVIMAQNGVLKSFPAMSKRDWRIALLLQGEMPGEGLNEIYPGGVAKWMKDWRCKGQSYKLRWTTRKKAMKKFAE